MLSSRTASRNAEDAPDLNDMNLMRSALTLGSLLVVGTLLAPSTALGLDPSNPANPYDFHGALHNRGLDRIIAERETLGTSREEVGARVVQIALQFTCGEGSVERCGYQHCPDVDPLDVVLLLHRRLESSRDEVLDFAGLEGAQREAAHEIYEALEIMSNRRLDPLSRARSAIAQIRQAEHRLLRAAGARESEVILQAASVARYSCAYWAKEATREATIWTLPGDDDPRPLGPIAWGTALISDYEFAVMGSVFGPMAGGAAGIAASAFVILVTG
ncbi:MAG: hypothetical protein AAF533_21180 [Acidobacteriota bacterium]